MLMNGLFLLTQATSRQMNLSIHAGERQQQNYYRLSNEFLNPLNLRSEFFQPAFNVFVAAVNLVDVRDFAFALCRQCRDEQGNSRTNIGRSHFQSAQRLFAVKTYYRSTVWIT